VDNEANEEVENDVFDFLATQSEEIDDDNGEIDTDTDDIQVLKDRISKRNQTIRKSKKANHRIQEENEALEQRLADLETKLNSPAPNAEAQNQERKEVLEQWRDSVADKPENALDYTNAVVGDLKSTVADLLAAQQADFDSRLAQIKSDIDPEKNKYRDKINSLRQNPDFADMDDDVLMKFAKNLSEKVPRGTVSGRRAMPDSDPDKRLEDLKAKFKAQYSNG